MEHPSRKLGIARLNRRDLLWLLIIVVLVLFSTLNDIRFATEEERIDKQGRMATRSRRSVVCGTLEQHMRGRWQHEILSEPVNYDSNTSGYRFEYLPQEVDWLLGNSDQWRNGCSDRTYREEKRGYMFASHMGNGKSVRLWSFCF